MNNDGLVCVFFFLFQMNMLRLFLAGVLLTMEILCEHLVEFTSNYRTNSQVRIFVIYMNVNWRIR